LTHTVVRPLYRPIDPVTQYFRNFCMVSHADITKFLSYNERELLSVCCLSEAWRQLEAVVPDSEIDCDVDVGRLGDLTVVAAWECSLQSVLTADICQKY